MSAARSAPPAEPAAAPLPGLIGFCPGGVAPRLVALLNLVRLGRRLGVPVRFLWLAGDPGAPEALLAPDFAADHIAPVATPPEPEGWRNLDTEARRLPADDLRAALAAGERFRCGLTLAPLVLAGEDRVEVRAELARLAAELPLATPLAARLEAAREHLAQAAGAAAPLAAIHLRRGDLLAGPAARPDAYVPDEFYCAWIAQQPGPVLGFADDPAAPVRLARGAPALHPVTPPPGADALAPAQRDLMDLLLLAGAELIAAPPGSAFSQAAALIGGARLDRLPQDLPAEVRAEAAAELLERVIAAPDSFAGPGDLAQSLPFAVDQARRTGQAARLVAALARARHAALLAAHPFARRHLALAAISAGDPALARRQAAAALAETQTQPADRAASRQLVLLLDSARKPRDASRALIDEIFLCDQPHGALMATVVAQVLGRGNRAGTAMMIAPELVAALAWPVDEATAADTEEAPPEGPHLPPWVWLIDWEELLLSGDVQQPVLRRQPGLGRKLRLLWTNGRPLDIRLVSGRLEPPADAIEVARYGLYGAALGLHHRQGRAVQVLSWLDDLHPGDPLILKRLSDCCLRNGDRKIGLWFLDAALEAAPMNPLLHLSRARRHAERREARPARTALARAEALWPGLTLAAQMRDTVEGLLAAAPRPGTGAPNADDLFG